MRTRLEADEPEDEARVPGSAYDGGQLKAELTVPPVGVGRIRPGQPVRLLDDAFPYERLGIRHGTVRWVSPAGVTTQAGPVFRALADVTDQAIRVDGWSRALAAGMGGRAEIVTARRTLLSHAFEPLRRLRERMPEAPAP